MELNDVKQALSFIDWSALLRSADGTAFPVQVDGEFVLATKVHSEDKDDADYDRRLTVVVEINGRYFLKEGWAQIGSHCYGDYEPSWNSALNEVTPKTKTITVWS